MRNKGIDAIKVDTPDKIGKIIRVGFVLRTW